MTTVPEPVHKTVSVDEAGAQPPERVRIRGRVFSLSETAETLAEARQEVDLLERTAPLEEHDVRIVKFSKPVVGGIFSPNDHYGIYAAGRTFF